MPVAGFLNAQSPDSYGERLRGFHQGLKDTGFVESENVTILYRLAENQQDRLPELTADLLRRNVAVIVTGGGLNAVAAAKAATTAIPIVFIVAEDPVRLGLVTSLARPEGNLTGVNIFNVELVAKRLELLRELMPEAKRVAVLVNPSAVTTTETTVRDVEVAARAMGLQIQVVGADTGREIDAAFANLARERPDAVFVGSGPFFSGRRMQLATLAARYALPMTTAQREITEAGGLMSYAANIAEAYRQAGVYAGRILKGAKPRDLPIVQADKFELVINAHTARMLGLTVSPSLLARAHVVIE